MNVNNDIKKILVSEEQLRTRCQELGQQINDYYDGKEVVIITLLKGAVPYTTLLASFMTTNVTFDYMKASSYHGTESVGEVDVKLFPQTDLKGRHVLIVDDIIDTGKTLHAIKKIIAKYEPASIEFSTLLDKPVLRQFKDVEPRWVGFTIPCEFVVGFGLDYDEQYRQLPYIGVLKEEMYK